jgi:Holliday junction resolvasome RuvABC DNA-binding subunit
MSSIDVYVWYNPTKTRYEIGSRVEFEMLSRHSNTGDFELLYRFNRLSAKLAKRVVLELNINEETVDQYT